MLNFWVGYGVVIPLLYTYKGFENQKNYEGEETQYSPYVYLQSKYFFKKNFILTCQIIYLYHNLNSNYMNSWDKYYKGPNQERRERIPFHKKRILTMGDMRQILDWYDSDCNSEYIQWAKNAKLTHDGSHADECLKEHKFMIRKAEEYYDRELSDFMNK